MTSLRILVYASILIVAALAAAPAASAEPTCVSNGSMDYERFTCVDPEDPKCPVYTLSSSDSGGVQKKCLTSR